MQVWVPVYPVSTYSNVRQYVQDREPALPGTTSAFGVTSKARSAGTQDMRSGRTFHCICAHRDCCM